MIKRILICDCLQETLSFYTIVIFVVSTTGQGDLPANARSFWKSLLRKKLPATFLNGVNFATFGLGDSSYPKYVLNQRGMASSV